MGGTQLLRLMSVASFFKLTLIWILVYVGQKDPCSEIYSFPSIIIDLLYFEFVPF